jgi:putative transcriptional regulator
MISHHPKFELLSAHVAGDLPASLSAAVTIHAQMCSSCQQTIDQLTEQVAVGCFGTDQQPQTQSLLTIDMAQMIDAITASDEIDRLVEVEAQSIYFKQKSYPLPKVLNSIARSKVLNMGKLSRTRLVLDEGEIHTNLLHIEPGGSVPEHRHKGFELTLLLDGSFSDEHGQYERGDFIMLDQSCQHHPVSEAGCLCYTVANDAMHFTTGLNKLLNPIGSFIY